MKDPFATIEQQDARAVRTGIWVLAFVVLAIVYAVLFPRQLAIVVLLLSFPVMIFLHELGHFVTAKRTGMKVTEFFVGFGPRLWSVKRGETEYGLKAIPLGGYCKIIGMTNLEDVAPEDEPRAYRSKRYLSRLVVAGAGSTVHFILAVLLTFAVLAGSGQNWFEQGPNTTLAFVEDDSPAATAGLRPGDTITSIDGVEITEWDQATEAIRAHGAGDVVVFGIERDGVASTVDVRVEEHTDEATGETYVRAGVSPDWVVPEIGVVEALREAPIQTVDIGVKSVQALGTMFSPSGIGNYFDVLAGSDEANEDQRFVSPVGFGRLATQAVEAGWVAALGLLISINVFVGLFNLVPLLPFDGGHIAIATYERIASTIRHRRVQVDAAKLLPITAVVVAILGFIFLSSLFLDIARPVDNPF